MLRRSAALAFAALVVPVAASAEFPVPEVLLWASPASASHARSTALLPDADALPVARLAWLDPSGIGRGVEAAAEPEVAELMRGMGIEVRWRQGDAHELARPGELRIILLNRPGTHGNGVSVLGATPADLDGEPHVWVHVPSVAEAVGIERLRAGTTLDVHSAHHLGVALGRVIAHEVVHALAPALPHGKGLMSSRLDRHSLMTATIPVDPAVGPAVRAALSAARSAYAAPSGALLTAETIREEPE